MENKGFLYRIANRILPPKAEVGFFQEIDPKNGKITNSSTRLLQAFFAFLLYVNSKTILVNVINDNDMDINKVYVVCTIYLLNVVAVMAPKYLKNSEVIQSFISALQNKPTPKP